VSIYSKFLYHEIHFLLPSPPLSSFHIVLPRAINVLQQFIFAFTSSFFLLVKSGSNHSQILSDDNAIHDGAGSQMMTPSHNVPSQGLLFASFIMPSYSPLLWYKFSSTMMMPSRQCLSYGCPFPFSAVLTMVDSSHSIGVLWDFASIDMGFFPAFLCRFFIAPNGSSTLWTDNDGFPTDDCIHEWFWLLVSPVVFSVVFYLSGFFHSGFPPVVLPQWFLPHGFPERLVASMISYMVGVFP